LGLRNQREKHERECRDNDDSPHSRCSLLVDVTDAVLITTVPPPRVRGSVRGL